MRVFVFVFIMFVFFNTGFSQSGGGKLVQPKFTKEHIYKNLNTQEAKKLMYNSSDLIVLDVRTEGEYNTGKIQNAINIDYNAPDFKEQLQKLDKNNTYLVYCRSGARSNAAMEIMKASGFQYLLHLEGGILAWNQTK